MARASVTLVFMPGFLTSPAAYERLLAPLVTWGYRVDTRQFLPRSPATMRGRNTVAQEAERAREVILALRRSDVAGQVWLGGHSRGGQAAWRTLNLMSDEEGCPEGLILIDPVDGSGRRPGGPESCRDLASFRAPTLIVGAGRGGQCAPTPVNHQVFARSTPGATHLVVTDLGHADVLSGLSGAVARRLCPGSSDHRRARATVTDLIAAMLAGTLSRSTPIASSVQWLSRPD